MRGFTLIEIMVVLAITGIVAGMAVVSIRDASNVARTQAQARAVADAFVTARNHSRSLHRCVRVELTSTQRIDLRVFDSCKGGVVGAAANEHDKFFTFPEIILVDSITTPSGKPLIYNPRGAPLETGPTNVTVVGTRGVSLSFEIRPGIGQVRKK